MIIHVIFSESLKILQIAETGKRLKLLLVDDAKPVVAQIAECLADWYKRAQTIYLKVCSLPIIEHHIDHYVM